MINKLKEFWSASIWNKIIIILFVIVLIYALTPTPTNVNSDRYENGHDKLKEETKKEVKNNYKTKITPVYDETQYYLVSCEDTSFDGEIIQAGDYKLNVELNDYDKNHNKQARVFDIWVVHSKPADPSQLGNPTLSVGGMGNTKADVTLKKGDYLVIKGVTDVNNDSVAGGLNCEKK